MEIKAPTPQVPPAVWTEFKDLQEWEKYRQERPEGDKHSALFESVTEGIHQFPGGFVVTSVADAFLNWARKSSVWPVTFGLALGSEPTESRSFPRQELSPVAR